MKTFLVKGKKPLICWGKLPNETYFEGEVPEGFSLAVSPWGYDNYVIIDVDKHGDESGFDNIPKHLEKELAGTLNYKTKNDGMHFWFKYTGNEELANKSSKFGIDLRTNKGYVVWYRKDDIRDCMHLIKETSSELNIWLESLFGYKNRKNENVI